jgi:hypothetical protein
VANFTPQEPWSKIGHRQVNKRIFDSCISGKLPNLFAVSRYDQSRGFIQSSSSSSDLI